MDANKDAIMRGKVVLVTGATSGIGMETARALALKGAHVLVGARDLPRGQAVVDDLVRRGCAAELLPIDLASWASVRHAAAHIAMNQSRLDVLVNNAATVTRDRQIAPDGHERIWSTNFLGAFLLTRLLLPKLHAASQPRVVNVSSNAHFGGRINWDDLELSHGFTGLRAYSNSKLALVLFTRELARREPRLAVNAVHPGVIATRIWRAAPAPIVWLLRLVLPSAGKGAQPVVRLATAPEFEGISGRYFDRFRETEPAPAARSASDAARLWEIAESATA